MADTSNLTILFDHIKHASTLLEAKDFLAEKGLPKNIPTWEFFFNDRIRPALIDKSLHINELHKFLRETEEHGRQHIFLYKCSSQSAKKLVTTDHLKSALAQIGKSNLLESPSFLDLPEEPELVDARIDSTDNEDFLVLKFAETRITRKEVETSSNNGRITKIYDEVKSRATNVVRLGQNGILELRIASHSTNDAYKTAHDSIVALASKIINFDDFNEVPLTEIKNRITQAKKGELDDILRVSQSRIRNGKGNCITAATGNPTATLKTDNNIKGAIDLFSTEDSFCEHSNFWFIERDGEIIPSVPVQVVISGHPNEFRLGRKVSVEDYEYILTTIWQLNRKVPK